MIFANRKEAGGLLATQVSKFREEEPLILALARGGAPVAAEVASRLEIPWSVLIVRKIGAPMQPEFALGAICENDEPYLSEDFESSDFVDRDEVGHVIEKEKKEISRQIQKFREGKTIANLKGRTVLVIDDGLATGNTMAAALRYLKRKGVAKLVVAVPIASDSAVEKLSTLADEIIALEIREDLVAIGSWYQDFSAVGDDEVLALMHPAPSQMPLHRFEWIVNDQEIKLKGTLTTVPQMKGLILFAHGSGSSRLSPRNQMVAQELNQAGFGTFLFDLLTSEESEDRHKVFDVELLSRRLLIAYRQLRQRMEFRDTPIGLFGASTGAGAALLAAAQLTKEEEPPFAIVSRGGRPDLASPALGDVISPTLLIVGERDPVITRLNEEAAKSLANAEVHIIPFATHLFEEEGALERVATLAAEWFGQFCESIPKTGHGKKKKRTELPQPRADMDR